MHNYVYAAAELGGPVSVCVQRQWRRRPSTTPVHGICSLLLYVCVFFSRRVYPKKYRVIYGVLGVKLKDNSCRPVCVSVHLNYVRARTHLLQHDFGDAELMPLKWRLMHI